MKRREFLQKGAIVVAGAAVAVSGVNVVADAADQWTSGLKTLNAHEGETLLKVARQIFPHDRLADTDYIVVVMDLDTEAAAAICETDLRILANRALFSRGNLENNLSRRVGGHPIASL